jgi:hypothetical protein
MNTPRRVYGEAKAVLDVAGSDAEAAHIDLPDLHVLAAILTVRLIRCVSIKSSPGVPSVRE